MPEGPEIRRVATRLGKVLNGRRIVAAQFGLPHLEQAAQQVVGERVESVTSRSKALITRFSNGHSLYSHNQLYGRWMVRRRDNYPDTNRQLRTALHTDTHSALLYSASDILLLNDDELAAHPYLAKLGPEALDDEVTASHVLAQLNDPAFHNRSLAALYLDQGFLAGIGNYLRSEILFFAGVYPSAKPKQLAPAQLEKLATESLNVTRRAYQTAGVTNFPHQVERLKSKGKRREQFRFAVFARASRGCYVCKTPVERITATSRRLYFCPTCQPAP